MGQRSGGGGELADRAIHRLSPESGEAQRPTVEHDEDLLPLRVAHLGRLAEEDLVLFADEDAVQDELAHGDVGQVPQAAVLAHGGEQLHASLRHGVPVGHGGSG